jgi:AraC-like DNA-binding protein/mannose-6-phosphate isomerase-like protein (cupin superfamily)
MELTYPSLFEDRCVANPLTRHRISFMRQHFASEHDPKPGVSISTLAHEYPPEFAVLEHAHGSDQVIYAIRGVMEVSAGESYWLIPPQFAVWIPARTVHRIRMPSAVSLRTLYLRRGLASRLPTVCSVLHVAPLLRELIVEAVRIGGLRKTNRLHCALRDVIVSQLQNASAVGTLVTLPTDPRALAVAQACIADQAHSPSLRALCDSVGVTVRTVERAFQREIGMNFETWRRQVRLMKAIELLVGGCPVKEVAFEVGYRQSSTFVEMFRKTLGTTPKAWVSSLLKVERR